MYVAAKGYLERSILKQFDIKTDMRIIISYTSIPADKHKKGEPYWENKKYENAWQKVYEDSHLIPTISTALLLLDGNKVVNDKILNSSDLSLNHVLFIYIPEIWNNDMVAYQSILADADMYYETAPFKGRSNQQDPKRGIYKSVGHGYIAHGGSSSKGDVVPYDRKNMPQSTKLAFRRIADSVASAMWKALDLFGGPVKDFFTKQFQPMNCIPIGLAAYPTQVHQLHMSKNSFIKPHIDKLDFDCSFICWFTEGQPKGGEFGVFQHYMKLQNNNGAGVFIFSKYISHGTLQFESNSLSDTDFKIGCALVNKLAICTRVENQLQSENPITWKDIKYIDYIDRGDCESEDVNKNEEL